MTFPYKMIQLRQQKNMSRKELADLLGVTEMTVADWEAGDTFPELEEIGKISEAFDVPVDYFLKDDTDTEEDYELWDSDEMEEEDAINEFIVETDPGIVFCTQCGKRNRKGSSFCGYCGRPLAIMREETQDNRGGSSKLTIYRDRGLDSSYVMDCYVNDEIVAKIKRKGSCIVEVPREIITFQCRIRTYSFAYQLDLRNTENVEIHVTGGTDYPKVNIINKEALVPLEAMIPNKMEYPRKIAIERLAELTGVGTNEAMYTLYSVTRERFIPDSTIIEIAKSFNKGQGVGAKTQSQAFQPTRIVGNIFGINDVRREWAIADRAIQFIKNPKVFRYEDLIEFELIEDGMSVAKGGLGRAAVGGMLFGGTGAIVGAATRNKKKQKCTWLSIRITVNNPRAPKEEIKLITSPTNKNGVLYIKAIESAKEIISLLELITSQNEKSMQQESSKTQNAFTPGDAKSVADEIREFKALLDEGLITQEEYEAKKRQLLGL